MIILEHVDRTSNKARFYTASIGPDLFGTWLLVTSWGRLGSTGQSQFRSFSGHSEALSVLTSILRTRHRHGYIAQPSSASEQTAPEIAQEERIWKTLCREARPATGGDGAERISPCQKIQAPKQ